MPIARPPPRDPGPRGHRPASRPRTHSIDGPSLRTPRRSDSSASSSLNVPPQAYGAIACTAMTPCHPLARRSPPRSWPRIYEHPRPHTLLLLDRPPPSASWPSPPPRRPPGRCNEWLLGPAAHSASAPGHPPGRAPHCLRDHPHHRVRAPPQGSRHPLLSPRPPQGQARPRHEPPPRRYSHPLPRRPPSHSPYRFRTVSSGRCHSSVI